MSTVRKRTIPGHLRTLFPGTLPASVLPPPSPTPPPPPVARTASFESELGEFGDTDGDDPELSADEALHAQGAGGGGGEAGGAAGAAERSARKTLVRAASAAIMALLTLGILRAGHLAVCALVFLIQVAIFKEVTSVRYRTEKSSEVPMFRTIQWLWFAVAIFFSYGTRARGRRPRRSSARGAGGAAVASSSRVCRVWVALSNETAVAGAARQRARRTGARPGRTAGAEGRGGRAQLRAARAV
jgi:hypothetical protein